MSNPVPDYVALLAEARRSTDDFVTLPRTLYVDLLQRVCSPLAPSTRHTYPLPNPHSSPAPPAAFPSPLAASLKKFL